jgi:hypothetical protein
MIRNTIATTWVSVAKLTAACAVSSSLRSPQAAYVAEGLKGIAWPSAVRRHVVIRACAAAVRPKSCMDQIRPASIFPKPKLMFLLYHIFIISASTFVLLKNKPINKI